MHVIVDRGKGSFSIEFGDLKTAVHYAKFYSRCFGYQAVTLTPDRPS